MNDFSSFHQHFSAQVSKRGSFDGTEPITRRESPPCFSVRRKDTSDFFRCPMACKTPKTPQTHGSGATQALSALDTTLRYQYAVYQYSSLAIATRQIRLMQILPDLTSHKLICCSIEHFSFNDTAPDFHALSYVWGFSQRTRDIMLNDKIMAIGENLWNFLNNARLTRAKTWLWIDALCIDQYNNQEKCDQVRLMGAIYRSAKQVLVWLGSDDGDLERLFRLAVSQSLTEYKDPIKEYCRGLMLFQIYHDCDIRYLKYNEILRGTSKLDNHIYWTRTWVVQEFILARKRTFVYGQVEISDHSMFQVLGLHLHWQNCLNDSQMFYNILQETENDRTLDLGMERDLIYYMGAFHATGCADPRDHVYAFLGLLKDSKSIVVDYDVSNFEVLIIAMGFGLNEIALGLEGECGYWDSVLKTPHKLAKALRIPRSSPIVPTDAHVIIPRLDFGISWKLYSDAWQILPPDADPQVFMRDPDALGIQNGLQIRRCYAVRFNAGDILLYNAKAGLILVMRKTSSTYSLVGRLSSGGHNDSSTKRVFKYDQMLACERYNPGGLYKVSFELLSGTGEPDSAIGLIHIHDLWSAIVCLGLPNYQKIRQEALALLSRNNPDGPNFYHTEFSSHDGRRDLDEWVYEQDPNRWVNWISNKFREMIRAIATWYYNQAPVEEEI